MKKFLDSLGTMFTTLVNSVFVAVQKVMTNVYSFITFVIVGFLSYDLIKLGETGLISYILKTGAEVIKLIGTGGYPLIIVLLLVYLVFSKK